MWLRDALEQGFNSYIVGAAEHAWRLSPSPQPPSSPTLRERKGEIMPCPRTFPQPLSVPTKKAEEQGCERSRGDPAPASCNDTESTNQFTPLPQRGRGAGGEGRPQRGRGAGGEGHPLGRGNVRRMTEQNVGPPTQCLLGHGTFPSSSRPLHIGHVPICTPIHRDHGNGLKTVHADRSVPPRGRDRWVPPSSTVPTEVAMPPLHKGLAHRSEHCGRDRTPENDRPARLSTCADNPAPPPFAE